MIILEAEYKVCESCGRRELVKDREYGCDQCKKLIVMDDGNYDFLSCTVFHRGLNSEEYHFCSWRCFFAKLTELETDDFIDFPVLSFERRNEGCTVADFWRAVVEIGTIKP